MPPSNAARAAPAIAERDPCEKARLAGARTLDSGNFKNPERTGSGARSNGDAFAQAAREYRAALPRRMGRAPKPEPTSELAQAMRRAFVAECLDPVPRDVAAACYALEYGDEERAFLHLSRIVLAVKEAARTFNELRADSDAKRNNREAA